MARLRRLRHNGFKVFDRGRIKMSLPRFGAYVLRAKSARASAATVLAFLLLGLGQGAIGDRLVLGINAVPYTQRQVEAYILVKESLRKTDTGASRVIDARSWPDALAVFGEDMVVLQEAERLGSYQNEGVLIDKFRDVVKQKAKQGAALQGALTRLGMDDAAVTRTLESVLRVAAFRKGKDKDRDRDKPELPATGKTRWLAELVDRAVIRYYAGAKEYVVIEPGAPGG
jgi:hypothetical protein